MIKSKATLRNEIIEQRNQLNKDVKYKWDESIVQQLKTIVTDLNASVVHTFVPMENEINLFPFIEFLLENKVTVITSKTLSKRQLEHRYLTSLDAMEDGVYGTKHPSNPEKYLGKMDLIVVPGLAFDKYNHRIGYGAGYYDIFLKQYPEAYKVGICYPFQYLDEIPTEPHDYKVDRVIIG